MIAVHTAVYRAAPFVLAAMLLIAGASTQPAHAQALPTATGPGSYVAVGGAFSDFAADYGSRTISGAGVYVDANLYWRYGIETEARRIMYPQSGEDQMTLLAGPRWSFTRTRLVPYIKLLAGGGRFDFPYGYGRGNYFVVAPGAGVDLRLGQRLRVRLIDVEYQDWPQFTFGAIQPYGISAGLSFQVLGNSRTKLSK
jgi:hypothetical protein